MKLSATPLPLMVTIPEAVRISGFSRSEIYLRLADHRIEAKKVRRSTMVLTESLLRNVKDLPDY